ncbi:MAG: TatD family hydrolase [Nitrospinota bacterium]|nr:YchF/TatD family DNA exonuclease [Nitrospinota bacterium]
MIPFIDTHAHLDMEQFDIDRDEVIERSTNSGITAIINVGTDVEGSMRSVVLAESYPQIYATVGAHPHNAEGLFESDYDTLRELLSRDKVIAVGETGLDYFKNYSPADVQQEAFRRQIRLAIEINKPLIVHTRDAKEDTLKILEEEGAERVGGVIHCYSGDLDMARRCLETGFFISFTGVITYPKAEELREIVKEIPLDRLLIETDCPYLAPQQFRGERNEPSYVRFVAEKMAEIKGISEEELSRQLFTNVAKLFGIKDFGEEDTIVYKIRNSLYVNLTNRCTNDCIFCPREVRPEVEGYNLKLHSEPSAEAIIAKMGDPKSFDQVVFCGFGEPTLRLETMKKVAAYVKEKGGKVRINTNGHGNIINRRNILPELKGLVDAVSISLDSDNEEGYMELCQPVYDGGIFEEIVDFAEEAKKYIPSVVLTVVAIPGKVDIERCRKIAEGVGVGLRVREYNRIG